MLAVFALSLLFLTQTTLASSSDHDWRDLRDLADSLSAEKRYAGRNDPVRIKEKQKKVIKPGYDEKCDQDPIDLGLIIDSSVSIDREDYKTGLRFLANFLEEYNIGPDEKTQVRVAGVSFGHGVYVPDGFNFTDFSDKTLVQKKVRAMPFRQGRRTDTGRALRHMRDVQMKMARPWAAKLVIVLTDGNSQETSLTKREALKTKASNITVFAVGVGRTIKKQELLNIAGGVKEHVFQADSYDDLGDDVKKELTRKSCYLVPKPTTTTTMPAPAPIQAEQKCGKEFPSDINFVFSPASMGLEDTALVTSIINNVIQHEELDEGFQYGVVSGDCPSDEGFSLDKYRTLEDIQDHLKLFDRNNLPAIVRKANKERFSAAHGARDYANKTAVIFLGRAKVDGSELAKAIREMQANQVKVMVSAPDDKALDPVRDYLNDDVTVVRGSSATQAADLTNALCHFVKRGGEGESFMPGYNFGPDDDGLIS